MPNPFAKIEFTDSVKITQDHYGTRRANERHENLDRLDELTRNEAQFISERDGSYLATVNEDGHPYLQFRGGHAGFLNVWTRKRSVTLTFAAISNISPSATSSKTTKPPSS